MVIDDIIVEVPPEGGSDYIGGRLETYVNIWSTKP